MQSEGQRERGIQTGHCHISSTCRVQSILLVYWVKILYDFTTSLFFSYKQSCCDDNRTAIERVQRGAGNRSLSRFGIDCDLSACSKRYNDDKFLV